MRQLINILIFSLFFTNCSAQKKYFEPKVIIDKTEEYKLNGESWISLHDKERVDGYTRIGDSIFGGEIACNVKPLSGIDIKSFKVLPGTQYAKDTNHVYYPLEILCIDYSDCGVCYYGKVIVEKANPSKFRYLGKDYAIDGYNVFFRGELIPNADGQTFKLIEGPEFFYFAIDKNNVYRHNVTFQDADPQTFYYDKLDKRNINTEIEHKYIIGDKDNEWEFVPPNTIKKISKK
jgi:hypothetical protein